MKSLIINADDFGYCSERNRGILECFQHGAITDATLLVNMKDTLEAVQMAKQHNLPIGLHLNLTEGPPIAPVDQVSSLVDNGTFYGKFRTREALEKGLIDSNHVRIEVKAQLDWFRKHVGSNPTHVDGHNHIHIVEQLVPILTEIFKEEGIRKLRIPYESNLQTKYPWLKEQRFEFLSTVSKEADSARHYYANHIPNLVTNHQLMGLGLMGSLRDQIELTVPSIESGITEYMVHPGYSQTQGLGDDFSYSKERENEMNNLKSEWFKNLLQENNVTLISWKSL